MPRLTREQSSLATRRKLIASARTLFAFEGFSGTSIDRIAEQAGYSRGAFYPHFRNKEAIFLEVLREHAQASLVELLATLDDVDGIQGAIDGVAAWADERSRDRSWALLILENVRHARQDQAFGDHQENHVRWVWSSLGDRLIAFLPPGEAPADAETIGALVFELAFGPAMSFISQPTAGVLVRLALRGLFQQAPTKVPDLRPGGLGVAAEAGRPC